MDKTSRLSIIAAIAARKPHKPLSRIFGVNLSRAITASAGEVKEETSLAIRANDDNSVLDEDTNLTVISPRLAALQSDMEVEPIHGHGVLGKDPDCLSIREHRELAEDLAEYRKRHGFNQSPAYRRRWALALVMPDPFACLKRAEPVGEPVTISDRLPALSA